MLYKAELVAPGTSIFKHSGNHADSNIRFEIPKEDGESSEETDARALKYAQSIVGKNGEVREVFRQIYRAPPK